MSGGMKTAGGTWDISVDVWCPCCGELIDVWPKVKEDIGDITGRMDYQDDIECPKCNDTFILTGIEP